MPEAPPPRSQCAQPWKGRKSRISSLGLIVFLGISMVTGDTLANPALESGPVSPGDALSLRMAELQDQMQADLTARVDAQMERMLQETTDRQMAAMRQQLDPPQKLSRRIEARTEQDLAALTQQLGSASLASARGKGAGNDQAPADEPALRMETGSLALGPKALEQSKGDSALLRHRFDRPFAEAPHVAVGVRVLHLSRTEKPRVAVRVVSVDQAGFDYEVKTWGDPKESDLRANWVAYAGPESSASHAVPASRH